MFGRTTESMPLRSTNHGDEREVWWRSLSRTVSLAATPMATSTSYACVGVLGTQQNVYVRAFYHDYSYLAEMRVADISNAE
jgi:hypothetical protein